MNPAGPRYLDHLSERDLVLLADLAGTEPHRLRADPALAASLPESEPAFQALFGRGEPEPFAAASPILAFAALVGRARRDVDRAASVPEWVAPGRSVPLLDVAPVRRFLEDPLRRLFLVELLASYTHVSSGTSWRRTARGWRRQRWSELDPIALARLLEDAVGVERLAILRRLGDAALFLTGVFPDHAGSRVLTETRIERVGRALGADGVDVERVGGSSIAVLELVGRRAYRAVVDGLVDPASAMGPVLDALAERFGDARRFLNVLAHRYLHPVRDRWFPALGA